MGSWKLLAAAVATLGAVVVAPAAEAAAPRVTWMPARAGNYTSANRPVTSIRWIVIHTTEGGFAGSISWLRNPRARASAHYVVSQRGEIAQLVRDSDIAWHAGNYTINRSSIGIEHEGYANRPGSITEVEYRASAQLSAWIARRALMPIDRKHFIGHVDVPDPNNPRAKGGFSHHHDPGPYWNWGRYLSYVKSYARGAQPPRYEGAKPTVPRTPPLRAAPVKVAPVSKQTVGALKISALGFSKGQTISGFVPWQTVATGPKVERVDFLVDGRVRWSDKRAPFTFGDGGRWDTTRETNGTHVLTVRVVAQGGKVAGASVQIKVVNTPFQVVSHLQNGTIVSGATDWRATATGGAADRVEFLVDGRLRHTEEDAPFVWEWDTKKETNGPHALMLRGIAEDGRVATSSVGVTVVNEAPPPPKPAPFSIKLVSLKDGETVRGAVTWEASLEGESVATVEFWIDGVKRWTETGKPYRFNGDSGRWDTAQETLGPHQLAVRAVHKDGRSVSAGIKVTVAAAASTGGTGERGTTTATLRVATASLNPGQTVSGNVKWQAEGDGLARVEYVVDGRVRGSVSSAPWTYDWNTRALSNGKHTLSLRASGKDGRRTESPTFEVIVDNPLAPLRASLAGVVDGASLRGRVPVEAKVEGKIDRVEFLVDGSRRHTERTAPYEFEWSTAQERDGAHTLTARVVATDGRVVTASVSVRTANAPAAPKVSLVLPPGPLSGRAHLEAKVDGQADRVEFLVDGKLRHTEQTSPYDFDWDTAAEADGTHVVVARALSGSVTGESRTEVVTANATPLAVTLGALANEVSGEVRVEAAASGTVARVEFLVDGALRKSDTTPPYSYTWDTKAEPDGQHVVLARAVAADGKTATAQATVTVENAAAPSETLKVTLPALTSPLAGTVHVEAKVEGAAARVEFLVDGRVRHTEQTAPYEFDWSTTAEANAEHVLTARAVRADGSSVTATATVTVANPTAALAVTGLEDGGTVTGTVEIAAAADGVALRRVELWIDGTRRVVDRNAPWAFSWDTSRETKAEHEVRVRAVTSTGRVLTVTLTVTVE